MNEAVPLQLKWMLRDEMASAALGSFPLTAGAVQMVSEHVQSTEQDRSTTRLHAATGAPGCQVHKVPLQFVFGPDQSFGKFLQVSLAVRELGEIWE